MVLSPLMGVRLAAVVTLIVAFVAMKWSARRARAYAPPEHAAPERPAPVPPPAPPWLPPALLARAERDPSPLRSLGGRSRAHVRVSDAFGAFLPALALQDVLVSVYVLAFVALVLHGQGDRRPLALRYVLADALGFFVLLALARSPRTPRALGDVAYRLALPSAVVSTFSQLHYLLPTARGASFDAPIYAFDRRVFGFEPAEAWDRFVTPATTEWFSFFYYLYFGLVLVHVIPMALFERRMPVLREFSWGIFWVFCLGQLLYVALPGYGPYRYLAPVFHHPLEGETFWPLVSCTVASFDGEHRTDIFPSLHTAVPTFLTLFAFRHRDKRPFSFSWPVLAFVTVNIVLATMFLRWHYLLDICAGLLLATSAFATATVVPAWDDARRARRGLAPIWRPLKLPGFGPSVEGEALESRDAEEHSGIRTCREARRWETRERG